MTRTAPVLRASLSPLADLDELARQWRALEAQSQGSFFRSWDWLGALLHSLPADLPPPQVLRVHDESGQLVGLSLWWRGQQRRHGFVHSRTLHLHETGQPAYDRITVEHNGLLARQGLEAAVLQATLAQLHATPGWDELSLSGVPAADFALWQQAAAALGLRPQLHWLKPYFFVDLAQVRGQHADYLEALSANTRYQVRRAMRLQAQQGPLRCELADSTDQALAWLDELMALHQAQWQAKGEPGAFGSEFTRRFHQQLVQTSAPERVWLTRLSAGNKLLGYLYNFQRDGVVYNYQAGHIHESDAKLKPGLVCHALAIQHALDNGAQVYDFMMGGGHFKSSLTNAQGDMAWASIQRPRLRFRLEDWLRQQRQRLKPAQPAPAAASS